MSPFPYWENVHGLRCQNCGNTCTLDEYNRANRYCNDCEFDRLTPPDWLNKFIEDYQRWDFYRHFNEA